MDEPFGHVVIVGCGLLGTSLGLAVHAAKAAGTITGVGRQSSNSVSIALERGAIDRALYDPALAVSGKSSNGQSAAIVPADLVVLCTPLRQFPEIFRAIAPVLAPGAIVTDVGSVKGQVVRWAAEILPGHAYFVGSHPMAGSEQSGPEAARADLLKDAVCVVCSPETLQGMPPATSARQIAPGQKAATDRIGNLWRTLGMKVIECSPDVHDQRVAEISHLPHVLAAALVQTAAQNPEALKLVAGGFLDTTRIAAGEVTMWTDILLTNRDAALRAMDQFAGQMAALRSAVAAGDEKAIQEKLAAAKALREKIIDRRKRSS